jgi:hypothetical protein
MWEKPVPIEAATTPAVTVPAVVIVPAVTFPEIVSLVAINGPPTVPPFMASRLKALSTEAA